MKTGKNTDMEMSAQPIIKNSSGDPLETLQKNVSKEEEKGSGKGKLPEHQPTRPTTVSFQTAIVTSNSISTPTITKTLTYCDNLSKNTESQETTNVHDVSDHQNLHKNDSDRNENEEDSENWESSIQDEELVVVVVDDCNNADPISLHIEEDTISAATTPIAYGNILSILTTRSDHFKNILVFQYS